MGGTMLRHPAKIALLVLLLVLGGADAHEDSAAHYGSTAGEAAAP